MKATTKAKTSDQWTEADARRVLGECKASGLSMRAFAAREKLNPRRLYWWVKRLATRASAVMNIAPAPKALRLVRGIIVKNKATRTNPSGAAVTIQFGERTRLEILDPQVTPAGWVAAVIMELERLSCS